jgi:hypothetical protein
MDWRSALDLGEAADDLGEDETDDLGDVGFEMPERGDATKAASGLRRYASSVRLSAGAVIVLKAGLLGIAGRRGGSGCALTGLASRCCIMLCLPLLSRPILRGVLELSGGSPITKSA